MRFIKHMMIAALIAPLLGLGQSSKLSDLQVQRSLQIPRYATLPSFGKAGAVVYVQSGADSGYYVRRNDGASWLKVNGGGGGGWGLAGNSGTNGFSNFIGTTDNQDFNIKRNGQIVAGFSSNVSYITRNTSTLAINPNTAELYRGNGLNGKNVFFAGHNTGYSGFLDDNSSPKSLFYFNHNTAAIQSDTIRINASTFNIGDIAAYTPTTTSLTKYKSVLMDRVTGALVTAEPSIYLPVQTIAGQFGGENPVPTISTDVLVNLFPREIAETISCAFPTSPSVGKLFVVVTGPASDSGQPIGYQVGAFTIAANSTYMYMWDGTNWRKISQILN